MLPKQSFPNEIRAFFTSSPREKKQSETQYIANVCGVFGNFSETPTIRAFDLANQRLQPLGHLSVIC
jgi:hypothetical protein